MVSTRSHPKNFPPSTSSPSKPNSTPTAASSPARASESSSPAPTSARSSPRSKSKAILTTNHTRSQWTHTPSNLTLLWLAISLPLVFWDTGYVFLRPHSMPGGYLHSPLWTPYGLYGEVDHIYGFKAWDAGNGFTAAQGFMNLVESAGYMAYLWLVAAFGKEMDAEGRGAPSKRYIERVVGAGESSSRRYLAWLGQGRAVNGKVAGWAVMVGLTTSLLTVSKTVLYWLNEYFSGFDNIGHNDAWSLIFLWILPNGAWIVLPSYMTYVFGQEILEGLAIASGESSDSRPLKEVLAIKKE